MTILIYYNSRDRVLIRFVTEVGILLLKIYINKTNTIFRWNLIRVHLTDVIFG